MACLQFDFYLISPSGDLVYGCREHSNGVYRRHRIYPPDCAPVEANGRTKRHRPVCLALTARQVQGMIQSGKWDLSQNDPFSEAPSDGQD